MPSQNYFGLLLKILTEKLNLFLRNKLVILINSQDEKYISEQNLIKIGYCYKKNLDVIIPIIAN